VADHRGRRHLERPHCSIHRHDRRGDSRELQRRPRLRRRPRPAHRLAGYGRYRVLLVGHQKGHNLKRRWSALRLAAPSEGYQGDEPHAVAASFTCSVICLIDTQELFPASALKKRGVCPLIAKACSRMSRLADAGGGRGIGEADPAGRRHRLGDRVSMLEHAYTRWISPAVARGILENRYRETKPKAPMA